MRLMAAKILDVSNDTLITHRGLLVERLRSFADQWENDLKEQRAGLHPHPKKFPGQPKQQAKQQELPLEG